MPTVQKGNTPDRGISLLAGKHLCLSFSWSSLIPVRLLEQTRQILLEQNWEDFFIYTLVGLVFIYPVSHELHAGWLTREFKEV